MRFRVLFSLLLSCIFMLVTATSFARDVTLNFTSHYTLPAGVTKIAPVIRYCTNAKMCFRVCVSGALAPSEQVSKDVFLPSELAYIQPGIAMFDNNNGIHYAYCGEKLPYSLNFTQLTIAYSNASMGFNNHVDCQVHVGGA